MFDIILLSLRFDKSGFSDYGPIHLILGASIGIIAVVIIIKKIINRNKK